jgi:hypothetical protein
MWALTVDDPGLIRSSGAGGVAVRPALQQRDGTAHFRPGARGCRIAWATVEVPLPIRRRALGMCKCFGASRRAMSADAVDGVDGVAAADAADAVDAHAAVTPP